MSEVCNTLTMDKESGFTLVELLVTIIVATVLLATGVPAFKDFIKNNRVTAQTNDLISTIQLARSEALKRGSNMVICASDDKTTCTGKDTWADGWIVFSDFDPSDGSDPNIGTGTDAGKCLAKQDCIMATREGLPGGGTLTSDFKNVCFLPTGLSGTHMSGACSRQDTEVAEFILNAKNCENDQARYQARKVTITNQGHTLISTCTTCACKS